MSLSEDTGPYRSRQWPTDFKYQGLKPPPLPRSLQQWVISADPIKGARGANGAIGGLLVA